MYGDGEVSDEVYKYIKVYCTERWRKYSNPCKGCPYKYPQELNNNMRCCIFDNTPNLWDSKEELGEFLQAIKTINKDS